MKKFSSPRGWTAGILLAALAVGSFAPAASADHGRGNAYGHYKNRGDQGGYVRAGYPVRRVVIERHSDNVGPALIGFIGGLIVGSAIHSHPVYASAPPPECDYYDSYCDERFSSMNAYENHLRYHHHPRVVLVVNVNSGECVGERDWRDGRWYQGDYSRDGNRGSRRYVSRYDEREYGQGQIDDGYRGRDDDDQGDDRDDDRGYGR